MQYDELCHKLTSINLTVAGNRYLKNQRCCDLKGKCISLVRGGKKKVIIKAF